MDSRYYSFEPHIGGDPNLRVSYYDPNQLINDSRILGPQGYADAVAFWYRPDHSESMYERQRAGQARHSGPGTTEHVKHRRTRSGCYTCRSRRVKCDEKRPICARCKKGNRECVYPEPSGTTKGGKSKSSEQRTNRQGSHSSEEDSENKKALETIRDEDEDGERRAGDTGAESKGTGDASQSSLTKKESTQSLTQAARVRQQSESSSTRDVASPSTEASTSFSGSQTPLSSLRTIPSNSTIRSASLSSPSARWSHLPQDVQTYLHYHQENVTFFHYFLKSDFADFIHTEFIDLAISFEPLLYAIVGFSAYHHTVRQPSGKLSAFLRYYSHSLSALRKALEKGTPSDATILTILTLGTFEEYLGDWVNLVGHHKAAHQLIVEMYTQESIMQTETGRHIFLWCARFDIVAGLMAGVQASLGREWYLACDDWFSQKEEQNPFDTSAHLNVLCTTNRLIAYDMAGLLAAIPKGTISMDDFMTQYQAVGARIDDMRLRIQELNDGAHAVVEFPNQQQLNSEVDIVNPYLPGGLFSGPLFLLNYAWIDWFALKLMYLYQLSIITQKPFPEVLIGCAYEQCRIFEAIQRWPESPPGAELGAHASLGIASVFLKKDPRSNMWCRRKLADLEGQGYVYPEVYRTKMAEMWQLPEVNHWWLPNEEGFHPILKAIRVFSKERASQPSDDHQEDIRDMKAIFSKLNIEDGSPKGSSPGEASTSSATVSQSPPGVLSNVGTPSSQRSDGGTSSADQHASTLSSIRHRAGADRMSGIWEGGFTG